MDLEDMTLTLLCMTLWTLCRRSTTSGARKSKVSKIISTNVLETELDILVSMHSSTTLTIRINIKLRLMYVFKLQFSSLYIELWVKSFNSLLYIQYISYDDVQKNHWNCKSHLKWLNVNFPVWKYRKNHWKSETT